MKTIRPLAQGRFLESELFRKVANIRCPACGVEPWKACVVTDALMLLVHVARVKAIQSDISIIFVNGNGELDWRTK